MRRWKLGVAPGGRAAWAAACCAWVAFIWGHSMVPGVASQAESDAVVVLLRSFFSFLSIHDAHVMSLVVRKTAHVLEYALLGLLLCCGHSVSAGAGRRRDALFTLIAAVAVPCIDETIQLLVPGRAGMVADVFLDLAGECAGALVAYAALRGRREA